MTLERVKEKIQSLANVINKYIPIDNERTLRDLKLFILDLLTL